MLQNAKRITSADPDFNASLQKKRKTRLTRIENYSFSTIPTTIPSSNNNTVMSSTKTVTNDSTPNPKRFGIVIDCPDHLNHSLKQFDSKRHGVILDCPQFFFEGMGCTFWDKDKEGMFCCYHEQDGQNGGGNTT